MSVNWERKDESADDMVYGSLAGWCYALAALGAAWFAICWAVTR